jgi:Rhodopirellula transposase DDE domain
VNQWWLIFCAAGIPCRLSIRYPNNVIDESAIRLRYEKLAPVLDERGRRRFGAAEAIAAGRGGVTAVMRATGLARSTIGRGLAELRQAATSLGDRVRRPGGGRKPLCESDASLLDDLRSLVEPDTRGDPQSPLLWTCKSVRKLCAATFQRVRCPSDSCRPLHRASRRPRQKTGHIWRRFFSLLPIVRKVRS